MKFFFEIVESATRDLECHGIAMPLLTMLGALPLVTLMGLPCAQHNGPWLDHFIVHSLPRLIVPITCRLPSGLHSTKWGFVRLDTYLFQIHGVILCTESRDRKESLEHEESRKQGIRSFDHFIVMSGVFLPRWETIEDLAAGKWRISGWELLLGWSNSPYFSVLGDPLFLKERTGRQVWGTWTPDQWFSKIKEQVKEPTLNCWLFASSLRKSTRKNWWASSKKTSAWI